MDQDEREPAPTVARNSNVIYTLPHDPAAMTQLLTAPVERVDAEQGATQLLVVAADVETVVGLAGSAVRLAGDRALDIVPVTSARRGARLLSGRPAHVVVGTPAELLSLLQGATLKLDALRGVVLAWADELLEVGAAAALETIMAEVPKEAARTISAAALTPGVEELIERYARRGRRVGEPAGSEAVEPRALRYLGTPPGARSAALRRLLDQLDPAGAAVYVRSAATEEEVSHALRSLGYRATDAVRPTRGAADASASLVVLYDLPANRVELQGIVAGAPKATVVALAQPRQLPTLRALAGGAPVAALALPGVADAARAHDERMRAELRAALADEPPTRELIALEPLLDEFDGVELAAAALRLLERERARLDRVAAGQTTAAASPAGAQWTRIFVNVGTKDGVRAGDLVGAIAGEAGITSAQIGKIELRETHSLVEVAVPAAESVVAKLTGREIRGRRVISRVDSERPPREGGDRPPRGERPERGERAGRGERPRRTGEGYPPRGRPERGDRSDRGERGDRAARPRFDRGERGERGGRGEREGGRRPPRGRE